VGLRWLHSAQIFDLLTCAAEGAVSKITPLALAGGVTSAGER
jgi:hypothetical protein